MRHLLHVCSNLGKIPIFEEIVIQSKISMTNVTQKSILIILKPYNMIQSHLQLIVWQLKLVSSLARQLLLHIYI